MSCLFKDYLTSHYTNTPNAFVVINTLTRYTNYLLIACWPAAGQTKLTISAPVAVIHWVGRKANISDVHAGLILQRHAPFVFHFENIALINPSDTKSISSVLDLLATSDVRITNTSSVAVFSLL